MEKSVISKTKTLVMLFSTVILWSSSFVAIRIGLKGGYDAGSLAFFRYFIASVCMLFLLLRMSKHQIPTLKELPIIFIIGVIGFGVYNVTLNYGEITVDSGTSSFILSQIPVAITLLAIIFLKERLSALCWLGMAISITGVSIIAFNEREGMHWDIGIIYLLIATFAGGFYAVTHKPLLKKYSPIEFTAYAIWSGTLAMIFYLPKLLHELPHASLSGTLAALYLGIFPACIGYIGWSYVLTHMPASKAGSSLYSMPIIATILGWLLLDEIPTVISLCGGLMALIGAIIISKGKHKH